MVALVRLITLLLLLFHIPFQQFEKEFKNLKKKKQVVILQDPNDSLEVRQFQSFELARRALSRRMSIERQNRVQARNQSS